MPRFRRVPQEIEAVQFLPSSVQVGDYLPRGVQFHKDCGDAGCSLDGRYFVRTANGPVPLNPGDWIIAEADGSGHYPCRNDIFAQTYEEITYATARVEE